MNNIWNLPNILTQKLPEETFTARVKLHFKPKVTNERFGFVLLGSDYACISVIKKEYGIFIVCNENINAEKNEKEKQVACFPVKGNNFYLQITMEKGGVYRFAFSETGNRYTTIEQYFTAKSGRWVGAKIGPFLYQGQCYQ